MSVGKMTKGFTLVELVVVLAMLAILLGLGLTLFNPQKQLNKAYDAQRIKDLSTIATALDTYYNDHNTYPQNIQFGSAWSESSQTYMEKIPNDPDYPNEGYCYIPDTADTPQWNVLFAKLADSSHPASCGLSQGCLPQGYSSQWTCKVSGKIDCNVLSQAKLPCITPPATPSPTPAPSNFPGVCLLRDAYTNTMNAATPDIGKGYAKVSKPGAYTVAQLRSVCSQADFQYLMNEYCKTNGNPAQYEVLMFLNNGSPSSTGCVVNSPQGCCFHSCSGGYSCVP